MMPAVAPITMYSTRFCPYCMRARQLLDSKGLPYVDIAVDGQPELRQKMESLSGRYTVPQIWIGDAHVGGFDDLWILDQRGQLDGLLAGAAPGE